MSEVNPGQAWVQSQVHIFVTRTSISPNFWSCSIRQNLLLLLKQISKYKHYLNLFIICMFVGPSN